jgi:hypothetical protein
MDRKHRINRSIRKFRKSLRRLGKARKNRNLDVCSRTAEYVFAWALISGCLLIIGIAYLKESLPFFMYGIFFLGLAGYLVLSLMRFFDRKRLHVPKEPGNFLAHSISSPTETSSEQIRKP